MTYRDLLNILRQDLSKLDQEIKFISNDGVLGKLRPVRNLECVNGKLYLSGA